MKIIGKNILVKWHQLVFLENHKFIKWIAPISDVNIAEI